MNDKNQELHRLLDQHKDKKKAQEINKILIEIEQTQPGKLRKRLEQLKDELKAEKGIV